MAKYKKGWQVREGSVKQKGLFIAIEGPNGSGKQTQVTLLEDRLVAEGYDVAVFSFPQYQEPSSFFVREYLAGKYGPAKTISPYVGTLFYALDRYHASRQINDALEKGKVVLADRFTASNMAHQGTKFPRTPERRGFYLWVDGVEAQMLGIPRPDKSIILNVPADVSTKLMTDSGKIKDEHEKDTKHHTTSIEAFQELNQLYPKDFAQIDCVRGGKLLSKESIHSLVWGTVEPLLPEPAKHSPVVKPLKADAEETVTYIKKTIEPPPHTVSVSTLLSIKTGSYTFPAKHIEFYQPTFRDESLAKLWDHTMSRLRKLHDDIFSELILYLVTYKNEAENTAATRARLIANNLLPLATLTHIEHHDDLHVRDDLPEARDHSINVMNTGSSEFISFARDFLPSNHAGAKKPIKLVSVWPRNELDLLPEMLFEQSNLSIEELRNEVAGWPISRKQDALVAYVKEHRDDPNSILSQYRYEFDMVCDTPTILDLISAGAIVRTQELTPRYGFDVPKLIEEADLTESYEEAFDTSMQLHSLMQSSNHPSEAQYATLLGHKQRYLVITSIAAPNIYRSYNKTIQTTCTMMREIILEHHNFILDFQDDQFVD